MNELTTEAKLQKIIEAQVKGGYTRFEFGSEYVTQDRKHHDGFWCHNAEGEGQYEPSILEFLLSPAGLKAVWENDAQEVGNAIFNEWFSTDGDANATIDLAFFNLQR